MNTMIQSEDRHYRMVDFGLLDAAGRRMGASLRLGTALFVETEAPGGYAMEPGRYFVFRP